MGALGPIWGLMGLGQDPYGPYGPGPGLAGWAGWLLAGRSKAEAISPGGGLILLFSLGAVPNSTRLQSIYNLLESRYLLDAITRVPYSLDTGLQPLFHSRVPHKGAGGYVGVRDCLQGIYCPWAR
jgi:hypothetical protein